MNNDYSFEQFQKRREEIRNKNTKTKKRLLSLFVTTFSIVLFSFLFIATIISPNLNIPALNDENIDNVGSSDFKSQSRVDYRLKQIQSSDTDPNAPKDTTAAGKLQNVLDSAQNSLIKVDLSTFSTPQMPGKAYTYTPQNASPTPRSKMIEEQQQLHSKQSTTAQNSQQPAPYVPNKTSNYKILVGEYSSPEEARQMVELFSQNSDSTIRPFVKSTNGGYAVQVGSYTDANKVQSTVSAYKSRNFKVRVIED